jgi:redox-regulated HSP33 family molecular chaperone
MSILIQDTTREERERIVAESIGNIDSACDGCSPGLAEMYQDYIDGKKELKEIMDEGKPFPVECQFCDETYNFTPEDISDILKGL